MPSWCAHASTVPDDAAPGGGWDQASTSSTREVWLLVHAHAGSRAMCAVKFGELELAASLIEATNNASSMFGLASVELAPKPMAHELVS